MSGTGKKQALKRKTVASKLLSSASDDSRESSEIVSHGRSLDRRYRRSDRRTDDSSQASEDVDIQHRRRKKTKGNNNLIVSIRDEDIAYCAAVAHQQSEQQTGATTINSEQTKVTRSDHVDAGSNNSLVHHPPTTLNFPPPTSLSQFLANNQAISNLLSGEASSSGAGSFPLAYFGGHPTLQTQPSLATQLASLQLQQQQQQQLPLSQPLHQAAMLPPTLQLPQDLAFGGLARNYIHPATNTTTAAATAAATSSATALSQHYRNQNNEMDIIQKMYLAAQMQNAAQAARGNLQNWWSGQPSPSLTSLSIQQLLASSLSSPYAVGLANAVNQEQQQQQQQQQQQHYPLLLGGATLSNEPNYSLGQPSLDEYLNWLRLGIGQAQGGNNVLLGTGGGGGGGSGGNDDGDDNSRRSIRQFAPTLAQLLQSQGLASSFSLSGRGPISNTNSNSEPLSPAVATTTTRGGKQKKKTSPFAQASRHEANVDAQQQQQQQQYQLQEQVPYEEQEIDANVPEELPFVIGLTEDKLILNDHQVFLRQQIEVVRASADDVATHTRGRTKPIRLGQIGIRCRHCAHILPSTLRGRGSVYFPSQLMGIYQVAQNMAKLHFLGGGCTQIPPEMMQQFQKARINVNSGVGRVYWTQAAKKVGLVDTPDDGIRFIRDLKEPKK